MAGGSLHRYWRVFGTGLSFTLFGVGGIILGYGILPLVALSSRSAATRRRRCRFAVHVVFKAFAWFMQTLGLLKWEVSGREILAREHGLVVANHPSLIDIVFLISLIPNAICIVKSAVYRNPFMRGPVRWAGYVPNHSPEQLLEDCITALDSDASLVIFPEGTRSLPGVPMKMKRGAAYIWLKSGCALKLVTITADPPMLGKHQKWYDVPVRPALFKLGVKRSQLTDNMHEKGSQNIAARAITRQWTDYFTKEIKA